MTYKYQPQKNQNTFTKKHTGKGVFLRIKNVIKIVKMADLWYYIIGYV